MHAQRFLQQHAAKLRDGAQAGVGQVDLVAVFLGVLDERRHAIGRQVLAAKQGHRHVGHLADIGEVRQRIERQLAVQRGRGRHAVVVDQEGVAVGRGARHVLRGQRAARAGAIFDHDTLPQRLGHGRAQAARDHIGRPAGRERHHQRNGVVGVGALRAGGSPGKA
ncbi:hypothetical protein D3C72_1503300 [compost metagenome]